MWEYVVPAQVGGKRPRGPIRPQLPPFIREFRRIVRRTIAAFNERQASEPRVSPAPSAAACRVQPRTARSRGGTSPGTAHRSSSLGRGHSPLACGGRRGRRLNPQSRTPSRSASLERKRLADQHIEMSGNVAAWGGSVSVPRRPVDWREVVKCSRTVTAVGRGSLGTAGAT